MNKNEINFFCLLTTKSNKHKSEQTYIESYKERKTYIYMCFEIQNLKTALIKSL